MNNAIRFQSAVSPARESQVSAVPTTKQLPPVDRVPERLGDRLQAARERLRMAAEQGVRVRVYEVALDLDMSEFHFARQFRAAFGCSPHVFYDEIRAARARDLLSGGESEGQVARRIGLRRPAELRALLAKRQKIVTLTGLVDLEIAW
ncbi:MAG: helix-turn-helix transcriptional regulator [Deltaproteobacteria bacterium]|nr:helix-turn-helix transcriptional regulator [Deltaproteobacteria bacterium]